MKILKIFIWLFAALLTALIGFIAYLFYLAAADTYPEDTFLFREDHKQALIIVAHDDDAVSMTGTIAQLCELGWDVREMCFYQGWKDKDPVRRQDLKKAADIMGLKGVEYHDILLRKDWGKVKKPWMPVPVAQVSLDGVEQKKKDAMLAYTTEQNSLTGIWPWYHRLPAKIYFSIFGKEYYRVLERENGFL